MTAQLLRRYLCRKVRKPGPLAGCRQRIRQVYVRAGSGIDRNRFSAAQETFFIQVVLEENNPQALEGSGESSQEPGIPSHFAAYLEVQGRPQKILRAGPLALLQ